MSITNSDEKEVIIKIDNMSKEFNTSSGVVKALDNINLDIYKGEIFGIIGLSGAGKSTLVRCINYLEIPTEGNVIFEGKNLSSMKDKEIRKTRQEMGMIFQQFNLLEQRNVLDNVCFPLEIAGVSRKKAKKRAMELLELVGLADRTKAYPAQLSGGQKQRVAIARAIATNPKVLLCDEATSALDPRTTKQILDFLKYINKELKITVIIITHEMQVIEAVCDRLAIIDDSHIAEVGDVAKVFAAPQSLIGKKLILGDNINDKEAVTGEKLRIIFDGTSSFEPVLSNMIISCKVPVTILYAKTNDINGNTYGQMVIRIPDNIEDNNKIRQYLHDEKIMFEEVK